MGNNKKTLDFIGLINAYGFEYVIKDYTRVTQDSRKCIDNIITNFKGQMFSKVMQYHISDHMSQKLTLPISIASEPKFNEKRVFNETNKILFMNMLKDSNWEKIYQIENSCVDEQWNFFVNITKHAFDRCFPLKKVNVNKNKSKNWQGDHEIENCKMNLDRLYVLKNNNSIFKNMYIETKKEYDKLLTNKKKEYYCSKIMGSDNKTRSAWGVVNEILGKDNKRNMIQGNKTELSNKFNTYLTEAAPKLLEKQPHMQFTTAIPYNPLSVSVALVDEKEVLEIVNNLKNKHSSGHDGIAASLVKYAITAFLKPLVHVINNSLKYGIFPQQLKLAIVTPVYKHGDKSNIENYRPN